MLDKGNKKAEQIIYRFYLQGAHRLVEEIKGNIKAKANKYTIVNIVSTEFSNHGHKFLPSE